MNLLKLLPTSPLFWFEIRLADDYNRLLNFLKKDNDSFMASLAEIKLEYAFKRGLKTPAYVDFLKKNKIKPRNLPASDIKKIIPIIDKKNYIKVYSPEERCIHGKFPLAGNIDESAGSSGHPTNWIRSYEEEDMLLKAIYFEYNYTFKSDKPTIVLSAWSTGPWATGIKFCELVEHFTLVKNTSTDPEDIKNTMKKFGNKYRYIISGYPIFLQSLFESDFPWKEYNIDIVTGGDGYSAVWPRKIKKRLKKGTRIVSSYGCSDIDIGIGFETPFAQDIREEASKNKALSKAIFGEIQTTPMLFQYNPLMHYIQNLPTGEFTITHLDPYIASPKIKYNIHDLGKSIPFKEVLEALKNHSQRLYVKYTSKKIELPILHLPFISIAGRSDGTVSFDGANVFPEQLDIIFTEHLHKKINKFKMVRNDNSKKPFHVLVELRKSVKKSAKLKKEIEKAIEMYLPELNQDYKESLENNVLLKPRVELVDNGVGVFKHNPKKIKYSFIHEG